MRNCFEVCWNVQTIPNNFHENLGTQVHRRWKLHEITGFCWMILFWRTRGFQVLSGEKPLGYYLGLANLVDLHDANEAWLKHMLEAFVNLIVCYRSETKRSNDLRCDGSYFSWGPARERNRSLLRLLPLYKHSLLTLASSQQCWNWKSHSMQRNVAAALRDVIWKCCACCTVEHL